MSLELHVGDHFHPANYDIDLEVVSVTDHATDGIGRVVYEAIDPDNYAWFVIEGVCIRGGAR